MVNLLKKKSLSLGFNGYNVVKKVFVVPYERNVFLSVENLMLAFAVARDPPRGPPSSGRLAERAARCDPR